jgi:hypothetical protein
MKVIITNSFEEKYLKSLYKNFSKDEFVKFLKEKTHTLIWLHYPYFKIKWYVKTISIRWVLFLLDKDYIIPLMVFLKKNKKHWENINWNDYKGFIWEEYDKVLKDIENWDFKEF